MALPAPKPGLVVRYDYLWSREHLAGRLQGKDRPACLVAASNDSLRPGFVVLLPVTHSPPVPPTVGVEIPSKVREALGLDEAPSWVIVTDYNIDEWPGQGLSPIPGPSGSLAYGFLPPGLFAKVKSAFLEAARAGATHGAQR